jgi:hypothetical protein
VEGVTNRGYPPGLIAVTVRDKSDPCSVIVLHQFACVTSKRSVVELRGADMRKFVAIVAGVLVVPVGGAARSARFGSSPRDCPSYHGVLAGEAVEVFRDFGPT